MVVRGGWVQGHGSAHHVAGAAEHLRQGGADDVAVRENEEVRAGADCVVHDDPEVVFSGQQMETFEVWCD